MEYTCVQNLRKKKPQNFFNGSFLEKLHKHRILVYPKQDTPFQDREPTGSTDHFPKPLGFPYLPGLVNIQKAIENGHRNSGFTH